VGAKGKVELWLTRDWFADLGFGYGSSGYSQKNAASGAATSGSSVSASVFQFKTDVGYTLFASDDFFGPRAWGKLGYHSTSYSLPASSVERTGSSSFTGLFLGVGGDLPIRGDYGALFDLDFGFINGASESGYSTPNVKSSSNVQFRVGGYYRLQPRLTLRIGFDVTAQGADFDGGGSVSNKVVSIGPSLQYYF
jgi:hypothetical protein